MSLGFSLIVNGLLLLGISTINTIWGKVSNDKNKKVQHLYGVFFGIAAIVLMELSWGTETGVIYDARTILISVVSVLYSHITTLIMVVIAVLYRVYLGGIGMFAGVLTIVMTGIIGIAWKYIVVNKWKKTKLQHYYIFGLFVHVMMLVYHFALPTDLEFIFTRIQLISPYILSIYPVIVVFLIYLIKYTDQSILEHDSLAESEDRYHILFETIDTGVFHFDTDGVIIKANEKFINILGSTREKLIGLNMHDLPNKRMRQALENVLHGDIGIYIGEYQSYTSGKVMYIDVKFLPMYKNNVMIGGVGVVEDYTEAQEQNKKIEFLSNMDATTMFYNRKAFEDMIVKGLKSKSYPIEFGIVNIENFQFYIDALGYNESENIVLEISNVIRETLPKENCLYRISQSDIVIITEKKDVLNRLFGEIRHRSSTIPRLPVPLNILTYRTTKSSKEDKWDHVIQKAREKISTMRVYSKTSVSKNSIDLLMASLFEKSKRERLHSERVSNFSEQVAIRLGLEDTRVNLVRMAGVLHDIGKLNIPNTILDKPGPLEHLEYETIKNHTLSGYRILSSVKEYEELSKIVLCHHERYDGNGYPNGIHHKDIPIESRIISVVDSFDAMIHNRPYREPLSITDALQELQNNAGTQFDPKIVDIFCDIIRSKTNV